ncbi:hypothetical protein PRVXH_002696 [Proteinivorax hydrogeniformans]|uniref:Uncharacterized protein n=1 Tax=Proteinivorax hydrogeniformans TaxID=1826727 RepID=A0AAU8HT20_9FIRM
MNRSIANLAISFIVLLVLGELFRKVYTSMIPVTTVIDNFIFAIFLFLALKIIYDIAIYIRFKIKLFSYFEDYIRQLIVIVVVAITAVIISLTMQYFINGTVRLTVLASIATVYFKN